MKLSQTDLDEILQQLRTNKPGIISDLARQFGVSPQRISQIKYDERYVTSLSQHTEEEPARVADTIEYIKKRTSFQPWKRLRDSPIQVGEYFIEVTRLYRNDGSGTSYLYPSLQRCILKHFRSGEEYRWGTSADYSRDLQQKIWDYLHSTYGEQILAGYYPCESTELIQAATWECSER